MFLLQQSSDDESWETIQQNEELDVIKEEKKKLNHLAALSDVKLRIIAQDQDRKRIYPDCLYGR
jgi:hypothetical protein